MCIKYLRSSVGRKAVMAVTGLFLYLFVIAHMLGNLQLFLGQDAINSYAEHLEELPYLLWPARVTLLFLLIAHMGTALSLAAENRRARPVAYSREATIGASLASRTMVLTGLALFAFIVYHLLHFTFDLAHPQYCGLTDAKGRDDVYSMVVLSFRQPGIAAAYLTAMGVMFFHLSHGVQSLFQSLGMSDENARPLFKRFAHVTAAAIWAGNSSLVLACYFGWIRPITGGGA